MSGKTSLAEHRLTDSRHNGTIGNGLVYQGTPDGQVAITTVEDETAGIGFAVGKSYGAWRLEGELMWRYRTDWDLRALTHSISAVTNVFSDVETTTLMLNAVRTQRFGDHWRWEIGAGVGAVHTDSRVQFVERGTGARPEFKLKSGFEQTHLAWGLVLGVSRQLAHRWRVDLHYRYLDLGDIEVGPFPGRRATVTADHTAHELQVSFARGL